MQGGGNWELASGAGGGHNAFFRTRRRRSGSMSEDASCANLLTRLRAGDPEAAARVVDQYARRLAALAGARLDRRILRKEDPEDVLQSVFKSFFHRCGGGQFRLDRREDLWALLVTLTLRKCGHRAAYY